MSVFFFLFAVLSLSQEPHACEARPSPGICVFFLSGILDDSVAGSQCLPLVTSVPVIRDVCTGQI
jgi:hypothetical protein